MGPAAIAGSRNGGWVMSGGHHRRRGAFRKGWSETLMHVLYCVKYFLVKPFFAHPVRSNLAWGNPQSSSDALKISGAGLIHVTDCQVKFGCDKCSLPS